MGTVGGISHLIARAMRWAAKNIAIDTAGDAPVVIVGSGRSGTSWLAELCNYQNSFRYIFEPLNPDQNSGEVVSWSPGRRDSCSVLASAIEGRHVSKWSTGLNRRVFAGRRLIKEIRLNLALDWVKENYPQAKIVKIVRNPLAVAASKKSLTHIENAKDWVWKPSLSNLLADAGVRAKLTTDQYATLSDCLGQGQVIETIADWSLNNLIVKDDVYTIWYENLCKNPEEEITRLFGFLNIPFHARAMDLVKKPSTTSRLAADESTLEQANDRWRSVLSESERAASIELLKYFDIEQLYSRDWQPVRPMHA